MRLTSLLLRQLVTRPDRPPVSDDPVVIRRMYERRRWSVFCSVTLGYGMFYLCRVNFSVVKKPMLEEGVLSATEMGIIGSIMLVVYAAGKLINGFLADRSNIARFMSLGLLLTALANLALGFYSGFFFFVAAWAFSGWFQAHGSAPSVVALSQWFSRRERGTRYGLWSLAHSIGEGLTFAGTAVLVSALGWRWGFWGPATVCIVAALILVRTLADRPETYGLPRVAIYKGEAEEARDRPMQSLAEVGRLQLEVLRNPAIWLLGLASACMYMARYGINNWGILYLQEVKGYDLVAAGSVLAASTFTGMFGAASSGWISDRFFGARRSVPLLIYGLLELAALTAFYLVPPGHQLIDSAVMGVFGFALGGLLVYLGGLMAVDVTAQRATGAAMGVIGLFSYLGAAVQDVASGYLLDLGKQVLQGKTIYSFDSVFSFWIAASLASLLLASSVRLVRARSAQG